jgi:hypothetical protein
MKPVCLLCAFVLSAALAAWPQTSTASSTHPAPKKTSTQKTAAKNAVSKTSASSKKGSPKGSAAASKAGRKAPVTASNYRRGPAAPTADRYREIQQALSDRGYLKNEPNGVWDQQSSDALKQFQTENNLTPTGKLSSLSLIQLGLGPKHDSAAFPPAAAGPVELPPEPARVPVPEN